MYSYIEHAFWTLDASDCDPEEKILGNQAPRDETIHVIFILTSD